MMCDRHAAKVTSQKSYLHPYSLSADERERVRLALLRVEDL
jgi:hypothetical protein